MSGHKLEMLHECASNKWICILPRDVSIRIEELEIPREAFRNLVTFGQVLMRMMHEHRVSDQLERKMRVTNMANEEPMFCIWQIEDSMVLLGAYRFRIDNFVRSGELACRYS